MTRGATPAGARGFWPLRDLPVVGWLLAVVVVAVAHPLVPAPRWLLIHLLLLGAVTHAILVWSRHFADALLHVPVRPGDRRVQSRRLVLLNGGTVAVVAGVSADRWALTVAGAAAVSGAVLWHGAALVRQARRALPGRWRVAVRYYVAATCCLPVGAALGTVMARGLADPLDAQLKLAHVTVNLFGWMGLTVAGTLVTLWPTMLRTRIADGAERAARLALPVLAVAVAVAAAAAIAGLRPVAAASLLAYGGGLTLIGRGLVDAARRSRPASFATWSVAAAVAWWAGLLVAVAIGVGTAPDWTSAGDRFTALTPFLAAGFGAQVLLGALSYLVPVALGGGPAVVRATSAALERGGAARVVTVNAALLLCALPVPGLVRVACSMLALAGLAAFIPLLFLAIRAHRRARDAAGTATPATPSAPARGGPAAGAAVTGAGRVSRRGQAAAGLAAVALAVAAGAALDPTALARTSASDSAAAGVTPTGRTTAVRVTARDMRFSPATIRVPAGDRLVITLVNTDSEDVHDLVLDSGEDSGRLAPGRSARVDVGIVGRDLDGWCSVVGHRQLGMTLRVTAVGASTRAAAAVDAGSGAGAGATQPSDAPPASTAAATFDPRATPGPGFRPRDAALPPLTDERVHRRTITVRDVVQDVAPGVRQRLWTFDGTVPGPVLHGRVGDVFEITLVNRGSIGHSIDFHAGSLAPDRPMRTVPPGQSLSFRFTATRAGAWMYHCATMPMSAHIANGLFGAVVIEPSDLPPVDRSYVLVQSELYLGPQGAEVDVDKVRAEKPDAVVFNGYANGYDHAPLAATVGERVRIWVLDAGPNRPTAFHVVGGQFDTVYREGTYLLRPGTSGSQALALSPSQGGFVELTLPEPGTYPVVSHVMVDAERGAHGLIRVTARKP